MKKTIILLLAIASFFVTSCDNGFEDLNQDPNKPVSVPSNLLIPRVLTSWGNNSYGQFVGMDMGWDWIQHGGKIQYNDEERYIPRQGVIENYWDGIYLNVISESNQMYKLATTEGNETMQGVALTLKAFGFAQLTDLYGDIPFTEALDPTNLTPSYTPQQDVYNGCVEMLNQAEALFANGNGSIEAASDIMYAGSTSSWRKFANSLKFRILMRTSLKQDVGAQLQELVNGGQLFSSNAEEAKFAYLGEQPNANPIYENIVYGTRPEHRMGAALINKLGELQDPRINVYAKKNAAGEFRGKVAGYTSLPTDEWNQGNVSGLGDFYLRPELPAILLSYSELSFLMAEAAQRNLISGDAQTYYDAAIRANMAFNQVDSDDFNEVSFADLESYMTSNAVGLNFTTNKLERIAEQKWIALFGQGLEAFTEWRRTPYPALTPAVEGAFDQIPTRYNYPVGEQSLNIDSYQAAIANQGADNLTTKLWFMP